MRSLSTIAIACLMVASLMATSARADDAAKATLTVPVIKIDVKGASVTVGFPRTADQLTLSGPSRRWEGALIAKG